MSIVLQQNGKDGEEGEDEVSEMESEGEEASAEKKARVGESEEETQRSASRVKLLRGDQFSSKPRSS